jgi:hypothetical protein
MDTDQSVGDDRPMALAPPLRGLPRAALVAAVVACAAPAAAHGQSPPPPVPPAASPPPSARAAAQQMSFAAYRLRVKVLAQQDAILAKLEVSLQALADDRCDQAVRAAPDDRALEVVLVALLLIIAPGYDPVRPALDTFLAELEAIPIADPILRSGRAGWRSEVDVIRRLPSVPDPCGTLQTWERAGYATSASPIVVAAVVNPGIIAADGKLARAARRMHALGVSAGAARRFTGDGMFADVPLDTL